MPLPRDDAADGSGQPVRFGRNSEDAHTERAPCARRKEHTARRRDRATAWNDRLIVAFWRGMYFALVIEVVCAVAAGVGIYFAVNYL